MSLGPALSYQLKALDAREDSDLNDNGQYSCVSSLDDEYKKEIGCSLPQHQFMKWRKAALGISFASIVIELGLGTTGLVFAILYRSPGAFGFAVDSVLDVLTTLVVIWRYMGSEGLSYSWERERRACIGIAFLFCISGICITAKAIFNLVRERKPYGPYALLAMSSAGVALLSGVVWGKVVIASKLQSRSLQVDAINTGCGAVMAFILIISLAVYHSTNLWFLDSAVAILIAVFLFVFGARTLFQLLFPFDIMAERL